MKIKNHIHAIFLIVLPLIFVSNTFNGALISGLSFIVIAALTYAISLVIDKYLDKDIRIYVYVLIMFTLLTVVTLCLNLWVDGQINQLGIYTASALLNILLIKENKKVTRLDILEVVTVLLSAVVVLVVIGLLREIIGTGSLTFFQMNITLFNSRFAIALLNQAAGGFILVALVFALIQAIFKPYELENKEEKL